MSNNYRFQLLGKWYPADSLVDCLVAVLREFCQRDAMFGQKFARVTPFLGKSRKYFGPTLDSVYPQRRDLDHFVRPIVAEWYVGTNENAQTILSLIILACKTAHVDYGKELRIPHFEL